jgi:hypothetical protein
MRFAPPLLQGTLLRRYKRFLADVELEDGTMVTAHCANSGSMLGCAEPGSRVAISRQNRPGRSLPYTWEMTRVGRTWVGVNTARPNGLLIRRLLIPRPRPPRMPLPAPTTRGVPAVWAPRSSRVAALARGHPKGGAEPFRRIWREDLLRCARCPRRSAPRTASLAVGRCGSSRSSATRL